jgi:N-acetylmuramoyl-L-alanine amidase
MNGLRSCGPLAEIAARSAGSIDIRLLQPTGTSKSAFCGDRTTSMPRIDGHFILFDVPEFAAWLERTSVTRVIRLLQVHHTYSPSYDDFYRVKDHFSLLRSMERFQMVERGFAQIAQNLTTFPDGLVAVCRPFDSIPAGIKGANQYGICVENLGNFDSNQDVLSAEHRDCIVKVYAHLCRRFNLIPDSNAVQYHHWWDLTTGKRTNGTGQTKSCPGTNFFSGNSIAAAEADFIPSIRYELATLSAIAPVHAPALYSAEVTADTLNVRDLPSMAGKVGKQLKRGVEVCVFEHRNGWDRIDAANPCWVDSRFLESAGPEPTGLALYSAQVTADLLNVRSERSSSASIVQQLQRGTSVYVYEEIEGWSRIHATSPLWVDNTYLAKARTVAAL